MPFRTVVGHTRVVSLISRAVARDTLPPALLFAGPAGIGKRRTAVALAEAINCLQPVASDTLERDACGKCISCQRIARGVHPDVIVLEPDDMGKIKIDRVRDVIGRAAYRPFEGRRRVVIIDEAHTLLEDSQASLLKTLEEPPSASFFVLVSSQPDALLATILSRCPRLRFGPLPVSEVAAILRRDHKYTDADASAAAADSDGSVGHALQAQSEDFAESRASAHQLLAQAARAGDPARRLQAVKDLTGSNVPAVERERLAVCLRALASLLRDLGLILSEANRAGLANADLEADLGRLAPAFGADRVVRAFSAVEEALGALRQNASPKVVADWLVLQL